MTKQTWYFSVHCFFSRNNGYSIPVKIDSDNIQTDEYPTDEEVIDYCNENNLFAESGDDEYVDTVDEIDLNEYNLMKR